MSQIGKESGCVGASLKLTCTLEKAVPGLVVRWFHNGDPIKECDRKAILRVSNNCIIEIVSLQPEDAGSYICMASNSAGSASAAGDLTVKGSSCSGVHLSPSLSLPLMLFPLLFFTHHPSSLPPLGPPGSMHKPTVEYITESSIALSWTPPLDDGASPIIRYSLIVSTDGDTTVVTHNYLTTATSCLLDTLAPGKMYSFRVRAVNELGSGEDSEATEVVRLLGNGQSGDGGLLLDEDFSSHYDVERIIAR